MEWRSAGWSVSASVNLPLHHKVQKFSSGTGSPRWSRKRAVKWLWYWCQEEHLARVALGKSHLTDCTPGVLEWAFHGEFATVNQ